MTRCNTCPNYTSCLKSGYCVENLSLQNTDVLLQQARLLWNNGCDAAAAVIDRLLEMRICHEDHQG
jgi:hypothetical protein